MTTQDNNPEDQIDDAAADVATQDPEPISTVVSRVTQDGFARRPKQQAEVKVDQSEVEGRKATRTESERYEAARERAKNFGGPRLKLSVIGRIPGFHLYWENDLEGAIEILLQEGFAFVRPSEVKMQSHIVQDADVGDKISRYVGSKSDGTSLRAYLLKCSDEHWQDREDDRYYQANEWEQSIMQGQKAPGSGRYIPKGVQTDIDTQFKKEY
jgi:hypothetical protein